MKIPRLFLWMLVLMALSSCKSENSTNQNMDNMQKVELSELGKEDQFDLIGKQWMLITAGTKDHYNTMTASWGGTAWLWNKPVAIIFVRPERYTHEFIEENESLTLSFYDEQYRKALQICGSKSGRDCDKVKEAGLTPIETLSGQMTFKEARMTIEGRKLFKTEMTSENFLDLQLRDRWYGAEAGGFHTVYIIEIENIYK